jgi:hypothetical protein
MAKKKRWVRLKRAIQKLKLINTPPQKGDGGFVSDKIVDIVGGKHQGDSTFVVKDTVVVARPNN